MLPIDAKKTEEANSLKHKHQTNRPESAKPRKKRQKDDLKNIQKDFTKQKHKKDINRQLSRSRDSLKYSSSSIREHTKMSTRENIKPATKSGIKQTTRGIIRENLTSSSRNLKSEGSREMNSKNSPAFSIEIFNTHVLLKTKSGEIKLQYNEHVYKLIECINIKRLHPYLFDIFGAEKCIVDVSTEKGTHRVVLKPDPCLYLNENAKLYLEPGQSVLKKTPFEDVSNKKIDFTKFKKVEKKRNYNVKHINEIRLSRKNSENEIFTGKNKKCYRFMKIKGYDRYISVNTFVLESLVVITRIGKKEDTHVDGYFVRQDFFNLGVVDLLYEQMKINYNGKGFTVVEDLINQSLKQEIYKTFGPPVNLHNEKVETTEKNEKMIILGNRGIKSLGSKQSMEKKSLEMPRKRDSGSKMLEGHMSSFEARDVNNRVHDGQKTTQIMNLSSSYINPANILINRTVVPPNNQPLLTNTGNMRFNIKTPQINSPRLMQPNYLPTLKGTPRININTTRQFPANKNTPVTDKKQIRTDSPRNNQVDIIQPAMNNLQSRKNSPRLMQAGNMHPVLGMMQNRQNIQNFGVNNPNDLRFPQQNLFINRPNMPRYNPNVQPQQFINNRNIDGQYLQENQANHKLNSNDARIANIQHNQANQQHNPQYNVVGMSPMPNRQPPFPVNRVPVYNEQPNQSIQNNLYPPNYNNMQLNNELSNIFPMHGKVTPSFTATTVRNSHKQPNTQNISIYPNNLGVYQNTNNLGIHQNQNNIIYPDVGPNNPYMSHNNMQNIYSHTSDHLRQIPNMNTKTNYRIRETRQNLDLPQYANISNPLLVKNKFAKSKSPRNKLAKEVSPDIQQKMDEIYKNHNSAINIKNASNWDNLPRYVEPLLTGENGFSQSVEKIARKKAKTGENKVKKAAKEEDNEEIHDMPDLFGAHF